MKNASNKGNFQFSVWNHWKMLAKHGVDLIKFTSKAPLYICTNNLRILEYWNLAHNGFLEKALVFEISTLPPQKTAVNSHSSDFPPSKIGKIFLMHLNKVMEKKGSYVLKQYKLGINAEEIQCVLLSKMGIKHSQRDFNKGSRQLSYPRSSSKLLWILPLHSGE